MRFHCPHRRSGSEQGSVSRPLRPVSADGPVSVGAVSAVRRGDRLRPRSAGVGSSWLVLGLVLGFSLPNAHADQEPPRSPVPADGFESVILPFVEINCYGCHSAGDAEEGVVLDRYADAASLQADADFWEMVVRVVSERQMPPADEPQPTADELTEFLDAVRAELASIDCDAVSSPGRVTIRRLNRVEYNNTIRDLLGVDFSPSDDFPTDDVGHGFDNIGEVLTLSTLLMEKYLDAAEKIADKVWEDPRARSEVFPELPQDPEEKLQAATGHLRRLATRAFRRPVTADELERMLSVLLTAYTDGGASEEEIAKMAIQLVLVSPQFLYRAEFEIPEGGDSPADVAAGKVALRDWDIASRLSYFLWSSMPDETLFALAGEGRLTDPGVLSGQVERMLDDPKSIALVDNFAGQWLQLRDLEYLSPDPDRFPGFDEDLRRAMRRETELFFEAMIREDRSVLEFLTSQETYVNRRLASFYGLESLADELDLETYRRVPAPPERKGVLTHAGILMLTSNPTRTSPVKRGQWVLDNILGEPPPPPPPGVEELEEDGEVLGSLRERMEQHRSNQSCAVCHLRMDTIGFGLENFDPIGGWREQDGRYAIDASGELGDGLSFTSASEMMDILIDDKRDAFVRALTRKLMTYALGRGLNSADRCAIDSVVESAASDDFRFRSIVRAIVLSEPFLYREPQESQ